MFDGIIRIFYSQVKIIYKLMFLYLENTYIIFTNNLLLDNPDLVRGSNGQKFFNIGYLNLASCLTRTFIQPVKDLTGKM